MTQHNPITQASRPADASPDPSKAGRSPPEPATEDWNEDPSWRKAQAEPNPGDGLNGLTPADITQRHIRMLNELIEQTYPLASEYLATARAVSPDAQGRDRVVSRGCKLTGETNRLIKTAEHLTKNGGG